MTEFGKNNTDYCFPPPLFMGGKQQIQVSNENHIVIVQLQQRAKAIQQRRPLQIHLQQSVEK